VAARRSSSSTGRHLLDADQLEELRLLTNSEVGQPRTLRLPTRRQLALRRQIKLGTFAVLDQRITLRYTMNGMTDTDPASYVAHHLKLAGRSDTLFSNDALTLIGSDASTWPHFCRQGGPSLAPGGEAVLVGMVT
jgi:type II secretory pathway predicted ATPase ExeA